MSALPPLDPALEPTSVRNGPPAAKQAYAVARSFEQVLVEQLTQELSQTVGGSSDGGSDGSSGASGLMGSDAASSMYASFIPQTLTSAIMSGGGIGIAQQLATAIDPALKGGTA